MSLRPLTSFKAVEENVCISKSPLLFSLLKPKQDEQRLEILDIGAARNNSIEYLSQIYCKVFISDCMSELCAMNNSLIEKPQKLNRALISALHLYKNKPADLDVILMWDIINYLDTSILSSMINYLLPHTNNTTQLHAYIHTSRLMPETHGKHEIISDQKIRSDNDSAITRDCPMYYQDALNKHLHPFKVKRSILHANGMQEYLFAK